MENESIMCNSCGTELAESDNFCPNCGAKRQAEPIRCKFCGKELNGTDKFCPNCGAKRNGKSKKSGSKKLILPLVLTVIIAIGVVLASGTESTSEAIPTTAPLINAPAAQEPAAPVEPKTDDKSTSKTALISSFASIVESTLLDYYSFAKVYAIDTGIAIQVANDGLGDAIFEAKALGLDESYEPWVDVRDSLLEVCDNIYDLSLYFGLDGIVINLSLRDDQDHDNVFLVIADGVVCYDYMAS